MSLRCNGVPSFQTPRIRRGVYPTKKNPELEKTSVEALQSRRSEPSRLLATALLFFLPHPLPQLLADVSQGVHFGRKGLHRLAEPDALRFPAVKVKKKNNKKNGKRHCDCDRWWTLTGAKRRRRRCLQEFAFVRLFHLAEVGRFGSLDGPEWEETGQTPLTFWSSKYVCGHKDRRHKSSPKVRIPIPMQIFNLCV